METKTLVTAFCLMALSTFLVIVGDTGSKLLSDGGFSQFWVTWSRFAIASVVLFPLTGIKRHELRGLLDWRIIFRAALICCAISSILTAIKTEPMANTFGAFFIGPIISYFLAWLVLKEQISWQRSLLLAISFVGVLIVVRPGFGMTIGLVFGLMAGAFHGTYLTMTRLLVGTYRPRFLLFSQLVLGAILMSPFAFAPVPALTLPNIWFLSLSAFGSAFGNLALVLTSKAIPGSLVAPLIYLQLISATVMGFLVFGQWPDALTFVGLVIIVASGLSSLWFAGRGQ